MGTLIRGDEGIAKLAVSEEFSDSVILVEIFKISEIRFQAIRHAVCAFLLMKSFIIIPRRLVGL